MSYEVGQSVANATRSRIESGSKHIIPAKMFSEWIGSMVGGKNGLDNLYKDKFKYCCNKNQLAIAVGRCYNPSSTPWDKVPHAYQPIFANFSSMENRDMCRAALTLGRYYKDMAPFVIDQIIEAKGNMIQEGDGEGEARNEVPADLADTFPTAAHLIRKHRTWSNDDWRKLKENCCLRNFPVCGVSLATIWAHPSSGDTVGSCMVSSNMHRLIPLLFLIDYDATVKPSATVP